MTLNVLILSGGAANSEDPPPLLAEQNGELLVERLTRKLSGLDASLNFVIRAEDQKRFRISNVIAMADPKATTVQMSGETQGAACSALLAVDCIDPDDELLILASNELLDIDYAQTVQEFRDRQLDGATVVFPSLHPRYSYVLLDENDHIVEAAEKRPISRLATAGFYWFRRGQDFIDAVMDMIRKDAHVNGQFYISLTFNQLVLRQKKLGIKSVESRQYQPLKSRRQVSVYENDSPDGDAP